MDNEYQFQNINNWESSQSHKAQKEDALYTYYRDQLLYYGEIDPNSFSLKYENGESVTEFNVTISKSKFDDEDYEWDKKHVELEIRHRVGDDYATQAGHWQISYVDATDKGVEWFVEIMIRNGTRVNEEYEVQNWENETELKLSIEDNEIKKTIEDLGFYARYIDEDSVKSKIGYEDNYLEFDLYIPKDVVGNFDKDDIEREIRSFLEKYRINGQFRTGEANAKLVSAQRESIHKNAKNYWKVHVYKNWGLIEDF
jgi:hypothetical protein